MDFGKLVTTGKGWNEIQVGDGIESQKEGDFARYFCLFGSGRRLQSHLPERKLRCSDKIPPGDRSVRTHCQLDFSIDFFRVAGPGSVVKEMRLSFPETFHPENEISFSLTVKDKNPADRNITLQVLVTGDERTIAEGEIDVLPPEP